ncbi:flagellar hook-associated protein 2 [Paenibacillus sp. J45TS6]|uniref:flagellar filament capping protein FliD n=1 Tax=Paenibacillus sp. J45TS6 TaxID=2807196 RepID=UPI001AFDA590|nr:flagellar filament capping protein FliD [Paenibacillus sp. J45TS6]GIP42148.1 flagellar hook-associated protein 2 [Paenibacillus sp. J45TS6]
MRVTGFSGFDVDSMVTSMMTASKAPLDKLTQQKQILNWQRDNYREVNSKLFDFKNKLSIFNKSAELNTQKAVLTGNNNAVKAEASANAQNIPMKVSVVNLAKQATIETVGVAPNKDIKTTSSLKDISGDTDNKNYSITISGKLNGVSYSKDFVFDSNTTISTVISTINSDPKANAIASFDEITGKLKISSKTYGEAANIKVEDASTENSLLKLFGTDNSLEDKGENAEVVINGRKYNPTTNSLVVNGISLTFLSVTNLKSPNTETGGLIDQKADTDAIEISLQTDNEKALSTIKSFIEQYNTLMSYMNTMSSEERYRDYAPLTDEQKKEMTDKDIELWEAKAKSGLLKNDEILKSTASSMRENITGKLSALSSLGITTGQYYENGKLYLDEDKFKQALQSNPQQLIDVFQGVGSSTGIFSKMSETINGSLDKLVSKAGTSKYSGDLNSIFKEESIMGRQLKDYNKRIDVLQLKLTNLETRYYKQFTAMETAMNKYNSQSSSLSSYFS